jgi:hypothetical protein
MFTTAGETFLRGSANESGRAEASPASPSVQNGFGTGAPRMERRRGGEREQRQGRRARAREEPSISGSGRHRLFSFVH